MQGTVSSEGKKNQVMHAQCLHHQRHIIAAGDGHADHDQLVFLIKISCTFLNCVIYLELCKRFIMPHFSIELRAYLIWWLDIKILHFRKFDKVIFTCSTSFRTKLRRTATLNLFYPWISYSYRDRNFYATVGR